MPFSAKGLLNDAQINLEKVATDKFGTAVEQFAKGTIGKFLPSSDANSTQAVNRNDGSWYATSYAAALSGATNYRPKLKFLFKVEFIFSEAAKAAYPAIFNRSSSNDFTFMIKTVDRPKVDFEYEEDVNMYNFRTKVLKKIRHRDLTVVFMDDAGNRVFDFFRTLMMLHSPITQRQVIRDGSLTKPSSTSITASSGMAFTGGTGDSAHRAAIGGAYGNSIEAIRVQQIFVDPQAGLSAASKMVSFDFMNPRVVSFDLDELSHEANDVNLLTMVFDYDWMEMVNVGSLGTGLTPYGDDQRYNIKVPGVNGAPSDISPNSTNNAARNPQGSNNGIGGILGGILGRGAQQLTADLIGKVVKGAGGGRFATSIGGAASSALGGPIGGLVSNSTRSAIGGIFSTVQNPNGRARGSLISDSTTAGSDGANSVVRSSTAYLNSDPGADSIENGN